jgi:carboxypeptidase Taq
MDYLAPLLQQHFGGTWSADAIYAHATRVKRSFIRVDADEVTYPLHVILRTRIEQRLLGGTLAIKDLPEAWNEQMQLLLGITPPDNASGCMQDIHWMAGSVGYFPTYTLGALTAAQLFASLRRDVPTMDASVARGDFTPVVGWLAEKVHAQGSLLGSEALLEQATGEPLNPKHFLAHVRTRYLGE